MSDNFIRIIPNDPWLLPDMAVRQKALEALKKYVPDADEVEMIVSDHPQFVHCGANLKKSCVVNAVCC